MWIEIIAISIFFLYYSIYKNKGGITMNETMNREIMEISVEDIIPNRFQPRLTFDTDALNELAN